MLHFPQLHHTSWRHSITMILFHPIDSDITFTDNALLQRLLVMYAALKRPHYIGLFV